MYPRINNDAIRHLIWSITSPSLYSIESYPTYAPKNDADLHRWCLALMVNPSTLIEYIETHEHRLLGSYFERLWSYFCSHYSNNQLLACGLQIVDSQQTLGELDLLARLNGEYRHIELAVKFYLRHPDRSGIQMEHWIGPQTKDRLDLKVHKLTKKQLPFLNNVATQAQLQSLGISNSYIQHSVIKGYLFQPWEEAPERFQYPAQSKGCQQGLWLHASKINELANQHPHWLILDKHQWPGPYYNDTLQFVTVLTAEELISKVNTHYSHPHHTYALMVIAVSLAKSEVMEIYRFMLVHNHWPDPSIMPE